MDEDVALRFRTAMRRFTSTVCVISAGNDGQRHGITATAVTSVSLDPPSVLVCVNRSGRLFDVMQICQRFCVNVLHSKHSLVSRVFAEPNRTDRFVHGDWQDDEHGTPYLRDAQLGIFCVKRVAFPYGSHTVFFGDVADIHILEDICPLLYQDGGYGFYEPLRHGTDDSVARLVGWG